MTRTASLACWKLLGIGAPLLIINRIRANMVRTGDMMGVEDILDILAVDLLGIVPDDDAIRHLHQQG